MSESAFQVESEPQDDTYLSDTDTVDRPFTKTDAADLIELVDRMQSYVRQSRDQGIGDQSIAFGLMKQFGPEFMGTHTLHIAVPRAFLGEIEGDGNDDRPVAGFRDANDQPEVQAAIHAMYGTRDTEPTGRVPIVADPTVPPGEARVVDASSGKVLGRIVGLGE